MPTLQQTFDKFADYFPIPQEERTRLFRVYKDTYERSVGSGVKNGQTQTSKQKPQARSSGT